MHQFTEAEVERFETDELLRQLETMAVQNYRNSISGVGPTGTDVFVQPNLELLRADFKRRADSVFAV